MGPNPLFPMDMVTFTEEIRYGKLLFIFWTVPITVETVRFGWEEKQESMISGQSFHFKSFCSFL